jgi:hypothetical protein
MRDVGGRLCMEVRSKIVKQVVRSRNAEDGW